MSPLCREVAKRSKTQQNAAKRSKTQQNARTVTDDTPPCTSGGVTAWNVCWYFSSPTRVVLATFSRSLRYTFGTGDANFALWNLKRSKTQQNAA